MKRYKFLREGLKSEYNNFTWEIGKWYKHEGEVKQCESGFHCSKEIGQAFSYVQGEILAEVEVRGKCDEGDDKDAWEEMRIVKVWYWKKENSVAISIFSAELCLINYEKEYPNDTRLRDAIKAAAEWLANPTEENSKKSEAARSAAESAARSARSAAESAAWSAESAAWSAAESAAWSARSAESAAWSAWSAAESAAESAWSAAESAAWSAAWSAAESAAWSARSAESAALKKIYQRFDEELTKLEEYDKR